MPDRRLVLTAIVAALAVFAVIAGGLNGLLVLAFFVAVAGGVAVAARVGGAWLESASRGRFGPRDRR